MKGSAELLWGHTEEGAAGGTLVFRLDDDDTSCRSWRQLTVTIRPGQEEWWRWRQTRSALWWSKPAGRATTIASGGEKNPSQKKVLKNIYRSEQECDQQCQTVQERRCSTVNMQICSTRNEQQCSTGEPISSSSLCFISLFSGCWNIGDNLFGQLTF